MAALFSLCQKQTNFTAVQATLLGRIADCFPFAADLAQARLMLYVPAGEDLLVLAKETPHTVFMPWEAAEAGAIIPRREEPLIDGTLKSGRPARGKREYEPGGRGLDMYTFPIKEGNQVLAVASLETEMADGCEPVLETVRLLLENARRPIDRELFRPLSPSDGIIIADGRNRIVFANVAALRIFRVLGVGSLVGAHLFDTKLTRYIKQEIASPDRPHEKEITAGELTLLQRSISLSAGGQLLRRLVIIEDVTELRLKDREIKVKAAVIQEIHHRVKNNLQMVASLLRLQARRTASAEAAAALKESVSRIMSISAAHELLSTREGDIDVRQITESIISLLQSSILPPDFRLRREFCGGTAVLPVGRASNLALVVNEIVSNSFEHGFCGRKEGTIRLSLEERGSGWSLDFSDDGCGLPADFSLENVSSLGLSIVKTLVGGDMQGTLSVYSADGLTHVRIELPAEE